jgi:hypothetical protein
VKIIAVYISLDSKRFEAAVRSRYQFVSNYLTLFISDWIKKLKLDLGPFNRIIFEEGNSDDLSIAGDRAFVVCLEGEFERIDQFSSENTVHDYFARKYLEGFERFDNHFDQNLLTQLRPLLEQHFKDGYKYESKAKSKKLNDLTIQALHRYIYDRYELVVQKVNKNKEIEKEQVVFTCDPDPFVVNYDANKIEIDEDKIRVINKIREEHLVYLL